MSLEPDSAEIEIDGKLMGTTPSNLQLPDGTYAITIRKDGFKLWERKLTLAGDEINLRAALSAEPNR